MNALTGAELLSGTSMSQVPISDDDLIRVCGNHAALIDAVNHSSNCNAEDGGPEWATYSISRDFINETPARTMAGLIAKIRAAKAEAALNDGDEHPSNTPAEFWSWDVCNELLAIVGQPHPDEALLELGRRLDEAMAVENEAYAAAEGERDDYGPLTTRAYNLEDESKAVVLRIKAAQATTLDGLFVKIRAYQWCISGEPITPANVLTIVDGAPTDSLVMVSILADLAAMAGSAQA